MGAPIGDMVFSKIKVPVIRLVCMDCSLSVKINTCEMSHGAWISWSHFLCVCSRVWGRQNRKTPIGLPWAWLTTPSLNGGSIGILGSPFYICGLNLLLKPHAYYLFTPSKLIDISSINKVATQLHKCVHYLVGQRSLHSQPAHPFPTYTQLKTQIMNL